MNVSAAYLVVIMIWSTTPLAIQWSSDGPGYLFGVTSRMCLGLMCVLVIQRILKRSLPMHNAAIKTYIAGGIGIYGAMLSVYWGAQYIPSGWVSMIFGLSPVITTVLAIAFLKERVFTIRMVLALILGLTGLLIIFISSVEVNEMATFGIIAVLISAIIHSASAVIIKRLDAKLHALDSVAGGLILAVPAYLLTWFYLDGHIPPALSIKNSLAILYLSTIATAGGFALYYFILKNMSAVKVASITMISPAIALLLGNILNDEEISIRTMLGASLILSALYLQNSLPNKNT